MEVLEKQQPINLAGLGKLLKRREELLWGQSEASMDAAGFLQAGFLSVSCSRTPLVACTVDQILMPLKGSHVDLAHIPRPPACLVVAHSRQRGLPVVPQQIAVGF